MWGTKIGSFVVSLLKDGVSSQSTSIFMRNGTQANRWFKRHLRINSEDVNYDFAIALDAYLLRSYGYGNSMFLNYFFIQIYFI
jgi:hypothetical protein